MSFSPSKFNSFNSTLDTFESSDEDLEEIIDEEEEEEDCQTFSNEQEQVKNGGQFFENFYFDLLAKEILV